MTGTRSPRRIGLFGGSFDPVHRAHLALAHEALLQLQLDELRWIPAGQPWQKTRELASPAHRQAMVALAIAGEPRFVMDGCELARAGPSYTVDTVRAAQAEAPGAEFFVVIGQDQLARLHTWRDWQRLLREVTLVVANRPGVAEPVAPEVAAALATQGGRAVNLPMMAVSSTAIRERLASGQAIDDLVPPEVARYIDQHHLYRGTRGN